MPAGQASPSAREVKGPEWYSPAKAWRSVARAEGRIENLDGSRLVLPDMAVAPKTGIPKWVALVSGTKGQNLRFAPPV